VHDELIARLRPRPGERWLDVATGTGAVALRAARAGAQVTGQDLAPELIVTARELAAKAGLSVDFEVGYARPPGADLPGDWVRRDYATALLGDVFDLEFAEAVCPWTGDSGAAMWQLLIESDGPAREGVAGLTAAERAALERDWIDYFERHRTPDGISAPRPYLLILGRRRVG
jgi:SAM-dependent methyltransferase